MVKSKRRKISRGGELGLLTKEGGTVFFSKESAGEKRTLAL